jgi:hypothetical protein
LEAFIKKRSAFAAMDLDIFFEITEAEWTAWVEHSVATSG